jgi:Fur family transcriptional regulator, stress-responsive regulator
MSGQPESTQIPERQLVDLLRGAGLRVTAPRLALLDELSNHPHADVDALAEAVEARLGGVSKQALYDALRALGEAGLVRRIEPAGSPSRFELRVGDNHHHVVCRVCGTAADVDCAVGSAPCLDPSQTHGYVLDEAEVTFWGVCPACQERAVAEVQAVTEVHAVTEVQADTQVRAIQQ